MGRAVEAGCGGGWAAVVQLVPEPAPAWELVEQLSAADAAQRQIAVAELRRLGAAAAPALERGLARHDRVEVRRWCAVLLQQHRRRASACAIVSGTHDRVAAVRLAAVQALTDGRADSLGLDPVPLILHLARHDRSKRVRHAAMRFLTSQLQDRRARAAVQAVAVDPQSEPVLRRHCADALDRMTGPRLVL